MYFKRVNREFMYRYENVEKNREKRQDRSIEETQVLNPKVNVGTKAYLKRYCMGVN